MVSYDSRDEGHDAGINQDLRYHDGGGDHEGGYDAPDGYAEGGEYSQTHLTKDVMRDLRRKKWMFIGCGILVMALGLTGIITGSVLGTRSPSPSPINSSREKSAPQLSPGEQPTEVRTTHSASGVGTETPVGSTLSPPTATSTLSPDNSLMEIIDTLTSAQGGPDRESLTKIGSARQTVLEWLHSDPDHPNYSASETRQRFSLGLISNVMQYNNWYNKENWFQYGINSCDWFGVECDSAGNVVKLSLSYNGLNTDEGIPPEVAMLNKLGKFRLDPKRESNGLILEIKKIRIKLMLILERCSRSSALQWERRPNLFFNIFIFPRVLFIKIFASDSSWHSWSPLSSFLPHQREPKAAYCEICSSKETILDYSPSTAKSSRYLPSFF